jgi:hypothetical protein
MYTISKIVSQGIILTCRKCAHIEHVNRFSMRLGSQRTQAARAMQAHSRDKHNASALLKIPKNYGVMEQW